MSDLALTPEQEAAVVAPGSTVVRAGAGSGKTAVLAHRYLHALVPVDGTPPRAAAVREILAITFTERAAAEMRRRIRHVLGTRATGAEGEARRRWEGLRRELAAAHVTTIHAFCARVLRENPLEAAVDPQAVVLEEQASRAWAASAVSDALVGLVRTGDPGAQLLVRRLRALRGGRRGGAVAVCLQVLDSLARMGRDAPWLLETTRATVSTRAALAEAFHAEVDRVAEAVTRGIVGKRNPPSGLASWREAEAALRALDPRGEDWEWAVLREAGSALNRLRLKLGKGTLAESGGKLEGVIPALWGALRADGEVVCVAETLARVAAAVASRRQAEGVLTFDDLVSGARRVLREYPAVRARYTERIRVLLVDEFQDTDPVQADVVRALTEPPDGADLFVVGDEKQSIYRFRGADVRVFRGIGQAIGQECPLGRNFRSQAPILAFVNVLAAHAMRTRDGDPRGDEAGIAFDATHRLVPQRDATWEGPRVRLITFAGEPVRKAAEARAVEGRVLAGVLADLLSRSTHPVAPSDIAVLFRTLTAVKAYEYALRRQGIPYYVVKGRGFFQCDEVRDLVSLLMAIDDADDGLALAALLRSPFVGLDDDTLVELASGEGSLTAWFRRAPAFAEFGTQQGVLERTHAWLSTLRRRRSRASIAELIEAALAETAYEAVCLTQFQGAQKVANVRKVIELARDAAGRRGLSLGAFVTELEDLAAREPRESEASLHDEGGAVVRLMTVHQAKGLEFPVTVLVDLAREPHQDTDGIVADEAAGLVMVPVVGAGGHPHPSVRMQAHRERERERGHAEGARLLYVACTRARDELILLEGRSSRAYLERGGSSKAHVWTHLVWDALGRERVLAAVDTAGEAAVLEGPDGVRVLVEHARRYRQRAVEVPTAREPVPLGAPTPDAERVVGRLLDQRPSEGGGSIAPTALADYVRCPRQYWYRHVIGLPEHGFGGRRARALGTLAHAALEAWPRLPGGAGGLEAWIEGRPEAALTRGADRRALARDIGRAAGELDAEAASGVRITGRELPFMVGFPLDRPRVFVQGRIDVVIERGAATVVRDYKWAQDPGSAEAYRGQLATYAVALWRAAPPAVATEAVFLRGAVTVRPVVLGNLSQEAERLALHALAWADTRGRVDPEAFPRRPAEASACRAIGCGYVGRCWRGAAGDAH